MWFVTVVEKMDDDECASRYNDYGFVPTGEQRTWGFYFNREDAVDSLHRNVTDMHEFFYNYAVIEEYDEGISGYTGERQWFRWDHNKNGFFEIDEPSYVKNIHCFALG